MNKGISKKNLDLLVIHLLLAPQLGIKMYFRDIREKKTRNRVKKTGLYGLYGPLKTM